MEMMVVLLIVAIIAAASAPMVTKKLSRSAGTNDSPWVFTGLNNSIAYNMSGNDNSTVIIGSTTTPANMQGTTRLYIDSGNNASHIAFGNGNAAPLLLTADPTRGRIGFSNQEIPDNSIAFGINQTLSGDIDNIIAIGSGATIEANSLDLEKANGAIVIGSGTRASGKNTIAIGYNANTNLEKWWYDSAIAIGQAVANEDKSIAIGGEAHSETTNSIAIGYNSSTGNMIQSGCYDPQEGGVNYGKAVAIGPMAKANDYGSIAIGYKAETKLQGDGGSNSGSDYSIAIGSKAKANHNRAVALGYNAQTKNNDEIVIGRPEDTVYIPGNLVVGRTVILNIDNCLSGRYHTALNPQDRPGMWIFSAKKSGDKYDAYLHNATTHDSNLHGLYNKYLSDRRLKNVGDKYTAGLAELKKLDFFHYTFKKDEEKTPHVGVIAQDLQKVFPDAVTKGEDGYLRIRWEDMFYAVINAVKELDNKTAEIVQNITDINSTIEKQNKTIEEQQKTIDELVKRIEKLEKQK